MQTILAAAESYSREHGVLNVKLSAVAKRAKVPTASVYRYFPSKSDLIAGLFHATIDEWRRASQARMDKARSAKEFGEALYDVLWLVYEAILKEPLMHEIWIALLADRSVRKTLLEDNEKWVDMYFMAARRFIQDTDERLRLRLKLLNELWDGTLQLAVLQKRIQGDAMMREAIRISCRELAVPIPRTMRNN